MRCKSCGTEHHDDDHLVVTAEWLRSLGALPDDSGTGDLFFKVWQPHEQSVRHFDDGKGFGVELFICADGEYGFEEHDERGGSLAIVTVGNVKTRGQVRALLKALGVTEAKP